MDRFDYLVVGAGFAGSVIAEQLASWGKTVLVVDQRAHLGGNAYDQYDDAGILVHKYGPHVFHTNSDQVFSYLSRFTGWRPYEHRVLASVTGELVPVPINLTTLAAFEGDEALAKACIIESYTRKQWGCASSELDPAVLARVKTRHSSDDRYFLDKHQAMPVHGYTRLFERLLAHPNIKILLKTSYRELLACGDGPPRVIYTGPIDEFFDYRCGRLPYRSASFAFRTLDYERVLPAAVVNYPMNHAYTRVTEFKQLTGQRHPRTTIAYEFPRAVGDPFWPVPKPANAALYAEYQQLAAQLRPRVHFVGRLATYKYLNMDQVVGQALAVAKTLITGAPHAQSAACQTVQ